MSQNTSLNNLEKTMEDVLNKALSKANKNVHSNYDKLGKQAMEASKSHLEFLAQSHNRTGRLLHGYVWGKDGNLFWVQNQAPNHGFISNFKDSVGFQHWGGKFVAGSESYDVIEDVVRKIMEDLNFG